MSLSRFIYPPARMIVSKLPRPLAEGLRRAKRAILNRRGAKAVFAEIYSANRWDGTESVSGPGSTMAATEGVRAALPTLLRDIQAKTLLDVPCGDAYWIGQCLSPGIHYIGGDIVPELVERNVSVRGALGDFRIIDLIKDELPPADLLLVRDCFIHLPNKLVLEAFANVRRAKIRYLLTTTFPNETTNIDIELGGYRPINLTAPPFSWPQPSLLINDQDGVNNNGKCLGLWKVEDF